MTTGPDGTRARIFDSSSLAVVSPSSQSTTKPSKGSDLHRGQQIRSAQLNGCASIPLAPRKSTIDWAESLIVIEHGHPPGRRALEQQSCEFVAGTVGDLGTPTRRSIDPWSRIVHRDHRPDASGKRLADGPDRARQGSAGEGQRGRDPGYIGQGRHDRDQRLVEVTGELPDLLDGPGGLAKHAPAHLRVRHANGCFEGAKPLALGHSVPVQHRSR